ncbi:hypothetical protein ILYODFUR_031539 [Ilyodon furcidens]|uniref:Uncharacterized protein n=1 Tax=Ilyodon furcidens TaxID=33524 RepID=A0ABV0UXT9_9TELE
MHVATVERKNSLLTGRNLQQNQAQCEWPSATTDWGSSKVKCEIAYNPHPLLNHIKSMSLGQGLEHIYQVACRSINSLWRYKLLVPIAPPMIKCVSKLNV